MNICKRILNYLFSKKVYQNGSLVEIFDSFDPDELSGMVIKPFQITPNGVSFIGSLPTKSFKTAYQYINFVNRVNAKQWGEIPKRKLLCVRVTTHDTGYTDFIFQYRHEGWDAEIMIPQIRKGVIE